MLPPRSQQSGFLFRATEAARRSGYLIGAAQGVVPSSIGTGGAENLKAKDIKLEFLNEVAALVADGETVAMMKQFPAQGVVDVFIASARLRYDCDSITLIARLDLSSRNRIQLVQELSRLFLMHSDKFDELLDIRAGIYHEVDAYYDQEVGDALLSLREIVWGCASEVDENTLERARSAAGKLIQYRQAGQRLKKLVPNVFQSKDLLRVYELSDPDLLANAFINSRNGGQPPCVRIYAGLPLSKSQNRSNPPSPNNQSTLPSPHNQSNLPSPHNRVTPPSTRPTLSPPRRTGQLVSFEPHRTSPRVENRPVQTVEQKARLYLDPEDRNTGTLRLLPVEKRQAFVLLTSLLQNRSPAIQDDAYLVFGYAACKDDAEIIYLRSLYHALLVECVNKQEMFKAFWEALKANCMVSFFEQNGYFGPVLNRIPVVVRFFQFPANKRPSVFRHVQFIRAENLTDPPAVLRRDYGYNLCKRRDEVEKLKKIYKHILQHRGPSALQDACTERRLYELAIETRAPVNRTQDKRFFINIAPHPDLGFEPGNLEGYQVPLFRKQK